MRIFQYELALHLYRILGLQIYFSSIGSQPIVAN